jgi:dienelactone hydrolase
MIALIAATVLSHGPRVAWTKPPTPAGVVSGVYPYSVEVIVFLPFSRVSGGHLHSWDLHLRLSLPVITDIPGNVLTTLTLHFVAPHHTHKGQDFEGFYAFPTTQPPHTACYSSCIPAGVKMHGARCCGAIGHTTMDCPAPAHHRCDTPSHSGTEEDEGEGNSAARGAAARATGVRGGGGGGTATGVLVGHTWLGLAEMEKYRAEQLAAHGYVAFALDVYGKGIRSASRRLTLSRHAWCRIRCARYAQHLRVRVRVRVRVCARYAHHHCTNTQYRYAQQIRSILHAAHTPFTHVHPLSHNVNVRLPPPLLRRPPCRPANDTAAKTEMDKTTANITFFHQKLTTGLHLLGDLKNGGPAVNTTALAANGYCFGGCAPHPLSLCPTCSCSLPPSFQEAAEGRWCLGLARGGGGGMVVHS